MTIAKGLDFSPRSVKSLKNELIAPVKQMYGLKVVINLQVVRGRTPHFLQINNYPAFKSFQKAVTIT